MQWRMILSIPLLERGVQTCMYNFIDAKYQPQLWVSTKNVVDTDSNSVGLANQEWGVNIFSEDSTGSENNVGAYASAWGAWYNM